jgi:hypothetical protein
LPCISSIPYLDSGAGEIPVVLTLRQIQQPLHGTSFSRWRSSCSSTGMASFSKDNGSSLAFAQSLFWRQAAEARMDLWPKTRW